MENSVQELIEMLYAMIKDAWGLPLGAEKCVIERDKALDLLDEIKGRFPTELAEARRLVDARNEFIQNAKKEAENIRKAAEDRAKQLVDENEIYKTARTKSAEMLNTADKGSAELRRVANEYVDDILRRTEEALSTAMSEMQHTRAGFRTAAAASMKSDKRFEESSIQDFDISIDAQEE